MSDYDTFGADYFRKRQGNDILRQKSYCQERAYLETWLGQKFFQEGLLLDVGCSTGEFIDAIGWNKTCAYGMEISDYARGIASNKGIRFEHNLFNSTGMFDLVVFRGTIQYIPNPFEYIAKSFEALKPGGYILFLATPNTNSFYYRMFKTLPFLEEHLNHWIPCDTSLRMVLRNCGFDVKDVSYPYLGTPYAHIWSDHWKYMRKIFFKTSDRFAFWRSSMTVLAQRPK
jgi:SAM-dependent methyltransferase